MTSVSSDQNGSARQAARTIAPFIRANWRSHVEEGMLLLSSRFGTCLSGSIVAERQADGWSIYAWTHPIRGEGVSMDIIDLSLKLHEKGEAVCLQRSTRLLFEHLLTAVLKGSLRSGLEWRHQVDRLWLEDVEGLSRAMKELGLGQPRPSSLADVITLEEFRAARAEKTSGRYPAQN